MSEATFTKFPNHILEAVIRAKLTVREYKIFLTVLRLTYGFHLESESISISDIVSMANIDRADVSRGVKTLVEKGVIKTVNSSTYSAPREISLEENIELWQCLSGEEAKTPTVGKLPTPTVGKSPTPGVGKTPTPTYYKEKRERKYKRNNYTSYWTSTPSYDKELFKRMINRD